MRVSCQYDLQPINSVTILEEFWVWFGVLIIIEGTYLNCFFVRHIKLNKSTEADNLALYPACRRMIYVSCYVSGPPLGHNPNPPISGGDRCFLPNSVKYKILTPPNKAINILPQSLSEFAIHQTL